MSIYSALLAQSLWQSWVWPLNKQQWQEKLTITRKKPWAEPGWRLKWADVVTVPVIIHVFSGTLMWPLGAMNAKTGTVETKILMKSTNSFPRKPVYLYLACLDVRTTAIKIPWGNGSWPGVCVGKWKARDRASMEGVMGGEKESERERERDYTYKV